MIVTPAALPMATPVAMPKLGMTMEEGRVLAWTATVGAAIERGQPLLRVESEKSDFEVEAPASGILRHVYVEPGTVVPCGTLLAAVTATADEPFDPAAFRLAHDRRPDAPPPTTAPQGSAPPGVTPPRPAGAPPAVTPAARARARELGVDPAQVPGSGPGGRVTREDVEAYAASRPRRVAVGGGVAIEVVAAGSGPEVLLLPGLGTDVAVFARQTPTLSARFRVLGMNPRGVAGSDAPEANRYDLSTLAADAARLVDHAVHVVGASLGAAVAIELALAHPERVRSLALLAPFVTASPRLLAVLDAWCRIAEEASAEALATALLPWFFSDRLLADPTAAARTRRGLAAILSRVPPRTLARTAAGLRAWSGTRSAMLGTIAVPTLVIAGADDLLVPDAPALADALPSAQRLTVAGAGHAVGLEAAEIVNAAILRHLEACTT